jgi:hypothetical protein
MVGRLRIALKESSMVIKEKATMRDFGRAVLERRYGELEPLRGGQGVPHGTRLRYVEDGKAVKCVIKVVEHPAGRISFPYADGTWGALSEVDRVLYVRKLPGGQPGQFEAQMHRQKVLLEAFNKNRKAAEAEGFTNLPAWLSADPGSAKRNTGSGFGRFAVWTEVSGASAPESRPVVAAAPSSFAAVIEKARNNLAADLGISAARIDINIRLPGGAESAGA